MIGISIGQIEVIQANAESVIVPLLVAMLYITFLQIQSKKLRKLLKIESLPIQRFL